MTDIPIIDLANLENGSDSERRKVAAELDWAASEVGFMYVKGLGIDPQVLANAFASSKAFYTQPQEIKNLSDYSQEINHGYQPSGLQRLDPSVAADLKEGFTMRDVHKNADKPEM
jgi:isopenicillin N synthase-like dioxygenase